MQKNSKLPLINLSPATKAKISAAALGVAAMLTPMYFASCDNSTTPVEKIDEDLGHIGFFPEIGPERIEIRVAPGVDRAHGIYALGRIEAYDTDGGNIPAGGRVVNRIKEDGRDNVVINKIIIVGSPEGVTTVRHIGGGVLEVRLNNTSHGGIHSILGVGAGKINDNTIGFIMDLNSRRVRSA